MKAVFIGFLYSCVLFFSIQSTLLARRLADSYQLRARETPCGYYLSDKYNDTMGEQATKGIDINDLQTWLSQNPDIDDNNSLYIVGAPFSGRKRADLIKKVRHTLAENGYKNIDIKVIRRLASFIEDQKGVFISTEDGLEKISDLNPDNIQEAINGKDPEDLKNLVVIGTPIFGDKKAALKKVIENALKDQDNEGLKVKYKSNIYVTLKKALLHPVQTLTYLKHSFRHFWPVIEDYQRPTYEEIRAAGQKLLIPGIITFSVLIASGQPLKVLIPVTLVNAVNSGLIGIYRTSFGNWIRRAKRFFPNRWLRDLSVSGFFSADLFWAGAGSVAALSKVLTFAGWVNFLSAKWLSIVFQSAWRSPSNNAIFKWEAWKTSLGEDSIKVRHAGAAMQKLISYIMTQFFIYSVITDDYLFKLVTSSDHFVRFATKAAPIIHNQETLLMNFNIGHAAMAITGVASLFLMNRLKWVTPAAKISVFFDKLENKFHALYMGKGRKAAEP